MVTLSEKDRNNMLTEQDIDDLRNTKTEQEWDSVCDRIKAAHKGSYPADWYPRVLASGFAAAVFRGWKKS